MESTIAVEKGDVNLAGHVDNVVLYRWFNDQRLTLFDDIIQRRAKAFVPPYVKTELQFKREVFDHEAVNIELELSHIGNRSFQLYQVLRQDGDICATCETVAVNFCTETQEVIAIDESLKTVFAELF
ncbi:acyl-CoA thioesterase [Pseudoteredinibacter isoporae]|uniref:acyl-CoA thioesterase n=1 Tax=Pseudoteredinibacter isoporae TaxID=570281 RepID=UPI00310551C3